MAIRNFKNLFFPRVNTFYIGISLAKNLPPTLNILFNLISLLQTKKKKEKKSEKRY
jgi:hypothetical protein